MQDWSNAVDERDFSSFIVGKRCHGIRYQHKNKELEIPDFNSQSDSERMTLKTTIPSDETPWYSISYVSGSPVKRGRILFLVTHLLGDHTCCTTASESTISCLTLYCESLVLSRYYDSDTFPSRRLSKTCFQNRKLFRKRFTCSLHSKTWVIQWERVYFWQRKEFVLVNYDLTIAIEANKANSLQKYTKMTPITLTWFVLLIILRLEKECHERKNFLR